VATQSSKILLLIAYLVGQIAVLPHGHDGDCANVPFDHHDLPHIHLAAHDHQPHSHAVDDHHHDVPHSDHADQLATSSPDHDGNAVYLPNAIRDSLPAKSTTFASTAKFVCAIADISAPQYVRMDSMSAIAIIPDEFSPHQPLWLALRALRI